jgi:deoxyribonuclease-4
MLLGAHERIGGGVSTAFGRAEADGADCLQIFTRNARGWAAKALADDEVARFRAEARRTGKATAAHSSYLINIACPDRALRKKSWDALADELRRCEALGIPFLVFHPGSHPDAEQGLELVAQGMARALEQAPGRTWLLIENTAGQGTSLGWRFEQVAAMRAEIPARLRRRVGVCVDTCHTFAAGYDIATEAGYARTMEELDRVVGLQHVKAFHLNDSKKGLGCRVDRHEHVGQGTLGLLPFRLLVNDARFQDVPGFVEIESGWKEDIDVLRGLVRR